MNYVQVRFLESHSAYPKAYTYKNNCDLVVGDLAVVTVAGNMKLVKVEAVSDTNPCQLSDESLKTVTGAVYLDPAIEEERRAAAEREAARKTLAELERVAEAKRRLRDIREELTFKDRARLDEARRTLGL